MKTGVIVKAAAQEAVSQYRRRTYAAMRQWGDTDRDDDILEGACEVSTFLKRRSMRALECLLFSLIFNGALVSLLLNFSLL